MYEKYRKNKEKEWIILKQLKTPSVIPISDRSKPFFLNDTKISKVLKKQGIFLDF
jgi:hypothetical protein